MPNTFKSVDAVDIILKFSADGDTIPVDMNVVELREDVEHNCLGKGADNPIFVEAPDGVNHSSSSTGNISSCFTFFML